jgi:hypothetical protein
MMVFNLKNNLQCQKIDELVASDGLTGETGLRFRNRLNDLTPGETYIVPEGFPWDASLAAYAGKTLSISNTHAVSGTITLPLNTNIEFNGGNFTGTFTLVGNASKIINTKNTACFPLTVTFSGNWAETEAAPQWFGAVCTANPKTIPGAMVPLVPNNYNRRNEGGATSSSAAIQKLFDSPFQPIFPNGYYYITAPTVITRSVSVDFGVPIREHIDRISTFTFRNDHVRFYTDQDINFWEYKGIGTNPDPLSIKLIGGVMDIQLVNSYSGVIYHIDGNFRFYNCEASGDAIGSLTAARVEGGTGTYLYWDLSAITQNLGYIYKFKIKTSSVYINRGVIIPKASGASVAPYTWSNSHTIDVVFDGSKIAASIEDGGVGDVKVICQSRNILTVNELTTQCITIGSPGSKCQAFVWDMTAVDIGGYYTPQSGYAVLYTAQAELMGDARVFAYNKFSKLVYRPKVALPVTHEARPLFLKQASTRDTFLSEFHNYLTGFHKIAGKTVSFKAYEGGAMNFDTELRDGATIGLTESANYTIANAANLFEQRGTPPAITITEAADRDTDFIEIVLTSTVDMYLTTLYASVVQNYRTFKRIQLIAIPNVGAEVVFDELSEPHANYRVEYWDFNINNQPYRKFIIRLIGSTQPISGTTSGYMVINDIAAKGNIAAKPAYIPTLEAPFAMIHALLNQTSTNAPTVATDPFLNTFYDGATVKIPITTGYTGVGDYTLTMSGAFTANKCLPVSLTTYNADGTYVTISRTSENVYRIQTFSALGVPTNGVLTNYTFAVNRYW